MFGKLDPIRSITTFLIANSLWWLRDLFAVIALCAFIASPVFARFHQSDADYVDQEERLSTENYNDEISYRNPFYWQQLWETHKLGVRANGGSYNAKRFMFFEDIKLQTTDDAAATFSFTQNRQQNLLFEHMQREIRVRVNQLKPFYFSFLTDGDSYKGNADFGIALSLMPRSDRKLEFYLWKVDHLYNTKAEEGENEMLNNNWSVGVKYDWRFSSWQRISFRSEVDTPVRWDRKSENYLYTYERRFHELRYELLVATHWLLFGSWQYEMKREAKDWNLDGRNFSKSMELRSHVYELGANYAVYKDSDLTFGALWYERDVAYTWQQADEEADLPRPDETFSPNVRRYEPAHYVTYFHRLKAHPQHGFQYGYHANHVWLHEAADERYENEIKFQFAWNYSFTQASAVLLNTTWDLDDMVEKYPYEGDNRFKPWGGGSLHFTATF